MPMKIVDTFSIRLQAHHHRAGAATATVVLLLSGYAQAQTPTAGPAQGWPAKPIRVLVGAPPGGTSDILVRLVGAKLTEVWGATGHFRPAPRR